MALNIQQSGAPQMFGIKCRNPMCRQKFFKSAWAYETHRRHPKNVGTLCADDRMRFERFVEFPANVATARLHRDPCKFTSTSRPLSIMPPSYLWPWD